MSNVKKLSKKNGTRSPKTLTLSTQERIELLANVILDKILAEKNKPSGEKG